jgi:UDP-N-acetylmuramate dehydrogenase
LAFQIKMHLDQKVSLKSLNTFGIEAQARYFVEAKTHSEVLTLLNYRHMIHMPILFLGGGSNVLFTGDFTGIVIKISSKGIVIREEDENQVLVTAEAGENWDEFVQYCVNNRWAGFENLSLIPGTVGAAPIQNIGAYGVEVKDLIDSVQVVEIDTGRQKRFGNQECRFGYRDSIFKHSLKGKVIILNVTFRLKKVAEAEGIGQNGTSAGISPENSLLNLSYGGIREELTAMKADDPTLSDVREAVCAIRRRKLPDPAVTGNAGSFFKNPVVDPQLFEALLAQHPGIPYYHQAHSQHSVPDSIKIPAAWLIEQCGWKGYRTGDAGVHPNQPLVLVNYGAATGRQILDLANRIMDSVHQRFGINLEPEVNVVG